MPFLSLEAEADTPPGAPRREVHAVSPGKVELEREGLTSFGRSVASALLGASRPTLGCRLVGSESGPSPSGNSVLSQAALHRLAGLADPPLGWSLGIPIVHLRGLPWPRKRMAAMTRSEGWRPNCGPPSEGLRVSGVNRVLRQSLIAGFHRTRSGHRWVGCGRPRGWSPVPRHW